MSKLNIFSPKRMGYYGYDTHNVLKKQKKNGHHQYSFITTKYKLKSFVYRLKKKIA